MLSVQQMQDRLVQKAGMEHPLVIWFYSLSEAYDQTEYNRETLYDVMLSLDDAIDYTMELD